MEQKIYFNGKETTQEFIDNYIKENGGFMACKMAVEYNNGFIKYSTQTPQRQKVYVVITTYRGGDDDEEHTNILGIYYDKEKALDRVWRDFEEAKKDSFMTGKKSYDIEKQDDSFTLYDK